MHTHFLAAQFHQQALGKRHDAGLGDVVVAHARRLHQRRHGGDIDDLALAALHQRQEGLAALDHAHQVDRDLPVPVLQRQFLEEPARGHAGVVDHHVDATELRFAGLCQCDQLAVVTYVAALHEAVATGLAHQPQRFGQTAFVDIRQRQLPAFTSPAQCDLATQPGPGTGHHHAVMHRHAASRSLSCSESSESECGPRPPSDY